MPKDSGIGASSKRREDVRFLTGAGNYTDDINVHGQAYVHFLRSDIAHGRIKNIDTSAAEAMPGVVKVFTGKDFEGVGRNSLRLGSHGQAWRTHARTAAPNSGARQGPPCGRPDCSRRGRQSGTGA